VTRTDSCHGAEHESAASLSGACHHGASDPVLAAATPVLLPDPPALPGDAGYGPAPRALLRERAPGHGRILLPPPRTA
jgi:hypothetical protein